jgi:hypothetical protein
VLSWGVVFSLLNAYCIKLLKSNADAEHLPQPDQGALAEGAMHGHLLLPVQSSGLKNNYVRFIDLATP